MKKTIVSTFTSRCGDHRANFENCPACDHKIDSRKWTANHSCTLVVAEVAGKHGSVVVVSECPKCFKKSWIHQDFAFFSDWHEEYPYNWRDAATKEHERRHRATLESFCKSQCANCQHIRSLEIDTSAIVHCTKGREPTKIPGRKDRLDYNFGGETDCDKQLQR